MSIKVSIALASYNGEKYIREQLDSILSQTVKDFELIVCDDCSKDSTLQILREYERKDRRIKIFENEQNLGFKKNFEKAILLCSGEYIALSDQDDIWTKDHLEKLFSIIGKHSLACGNALMVDENGKSLGKNLNEVDGLFKMRYLVNAKFLQV
ncbi:glycosyltransferase [uncultured Treponema sp.]|uniref:glycosyltransferase n=1 Tax=uncultured Treponema sp. TaxID=162155 RepID=UPI0025CEF617|nr:glycosyltransferase [uncultured Treponema sp.]